MFFPKIASATNTPHFLDFLDLNRTSVRGEYSVPTMMCDVQRARIGKLNADKVYERKESEI